MKPTKSLRKILAEEKTILVPGAYDALSDLGVRLSVYTNHGTADNVQNVGGDASYHQGDIVGGDAYHTDLFSPNGVRYVWSDRCIFTFPANLKDMAKRLLKKKSSDSVLFKSPLQDGTSVFRFYRFRSSGKEAPNCSLLKHQTRQLGLERLYNKERIAILYQHPGVFMKKDKTYKA